MFKRRSQRNCELGGVGSLVEDRPTTKSLSKFFLKREFKEELNTSVVKILQHFNNVNQDILH